MPDSQDTRIHLSCQHFRCDSFRFDKQKRRLILPFSSTRQTSTVKCPQCKGRMHVYDHGVMHVKDMPLQYGTTQTLEVHYHRYRCPHCGKTSSEEVPLTYPETRITHRAAAWVKGLMRWQMPVSTVQKITGIHWETIRRIHKQTMDEALVRRWLQTRDSGYRPTYLAVDVFNQEFLIHLIGTKCTTLKRPCLPPPQEEAKPI